MVRWLFPAVGAALMATAIWTLANRPSSPAPAARTRTVAFDNRYGNVERLPIHVRVDGGVEQAVTAACDARTCAFDLPLTNARHELLISVEHNGQRSAPTRVTLDTSAVR